MPSEEVSCPLVSILHRQIRPQLAGRLSAFLRSFICWRWLPSGAFPALLLTYGEGWHNNHHAYPYVAKAGWQWWEVDVTWWAIDLLQRLGLARKVNLPPEI